MRDEEGLSIQPDDGKPLTTHNVIDTLMAGTHGVIQFLADKAGVDADAAMQMFAKELVENEEGYGVDTVTEKFAEGAES